MKVRFRKSFSKDFACLDSKISHAFEMRLKVFFQNPYDAKLSNHPLKGRWQGYRSINISGDFRAVYKEIDDETVIFAAIGSHSQLYG
ncbi:MAG: type II toxin-antitoxin system mRNA interferase toxin, RelE/StbE family [Patescibacteria group bacterium]